MGALGEGVLVDQLPCILQERVDLRPGAVVYREQRELPKALCLGRGHEAVREAHPLLQARSRQLALTEQAKGCALQETRDRAPGTSGTVEIERERGVVPYARDTLASDDRPEEQGCGAQRRAVGQQLVL